MGLSAVMGLVVEEMRQRRSEALADRAHVRYRDVGEAAVEFLFRQSFDIVGDARILGLSRDRCSAPKASWMIASSRAGCVAVAREAVHPDAVGDEDMVERALHRGEEGVDVAAELLRRELGGRAVEPGIGPGIVGGERANGVRLM